MLLSQRLANEFWKKLGEIALCDYEIATAYDKVIDDLCKLIVPDDEKRLIDLAFTEQLTQDELDDFLQNWDIERYGAQKALLLAYVQKKWPQLDFGVYTGPRLKGLRSYYRFHNLELIAQYRKIVGRLNDIGIVPLVMKGGAMKHLRPELPRVMGDIDVLIADKKQFKQAMDIAASMGYTLSEARHSVDLYKAGTEQGVLDIHRYIDDCCSDYDKFNQAILSRAKEENVFGTRSLVPCNEDLVFIQLLNLGKNLAEYSSISGIMYVIFDLAYLTAKADFDWKIVQENMALTSMYWQIYLAGIFLNKIVPNLLPDLLNEGSADSLIEELNKRYFYAKYIHEARYKRKELYLWKVFAGRQSLAEYIRVKGKYQLLKHIWRSPRLLNLFFYGVRKFKKWNI